MSRIALFLTLAATIALGARSTHMRPNEPTRTVWDSVYSDSQAARGAVGYQKTCARCHGATLAGTDSASELTGNSFLGDWNALTVGDLFDKTMTSMPPDNPKSVPSKQMADIVAYLLGQNHFPAGAGELPDDMGQLKNIKIVINKP